jgi:hypothetical protein
MSCALLFKTRVLLLVPKVIVHLYCICQEHPLDWIVACPFKQIIHIHASVQAHGWPFLTFVVTRVNMRNVFCCKLSEYAHIRQWSRYFWLTLCKWFGAADNKLFHIDLVVFKSNWRKAGFTNHCLSFLGIALCHTHLPAPQLESWNYSELPLNSLYTVTATKENLFHCF